ncbi:hypothetical protein AB0L14_31380 [Streptomyces sp. NPDC052727]|uniref:hypothetical protein n=1 Tax=Streptomyces sp. NPDC052727 TaxID=3154854 RepID=UPI0034337800
MPPPLPGTAWVLGALYEHERLPADVTYDAYHRARLAEGGAPRETAGRIGLTGVGTATAGGPVRAGHPGVRPARRRAAAVRRPEGRLQEAVRLPWAP